MSKSEVAQLRGRIEDEFISMRMGLSGLAAGVAKHQFIEAKMRNLRVHENQLAQHIGGEQAILFSCQAYIRVIEGE